eukprot:gene10705-14373_t
MDSKSKKNSGDESRAAVKGTVYGLGKTNILELDTSRLIEVNSRAYELPHTIFIVDRSGSMGVHTSHVINCYIPDAFTKLGVDASTVVTVVTFDQCAERIIDSNGSDPTLTYLKHASVNSRGPTNMRTVIPILQKIVKDIATQIPIIIVAISDGDVNDIDLSVKAAEAVRAEITNRIAPISVCLYRLMTSPQAAPDTRALTCFGQYDTSSAGEVCLKDISYGNIKKDFTSTLVSDLKDLFTTCYVEIKTNSAILRKMPFDPLTNSFSIPIGGSSFILVEDISDLSSIICNGNSIELEYADLKEESQISQFLELVQKQLRMYMVMNAHQDKITIIIEFVQYLELYFRSKVSEIENFTYKSIKIRDRVHNIMKELSRSSKSLIINILSLSNADRVIALNNAQKAAFLRGDIKNTRTAKRAGSDLDYANIAIKCAEKVATKLSDIDIIMASEDISYYSQSSFSEILIAFGELVSVADQLDLEQILTLIGGMGIAIHCIQADYLDPWQARVDRVYLGVHLSSNDLCLAALLDSGGLPIQFPGYNEDAPINGVVPIRELNPVAYDLYMSSCRKIADFHASFALRGSLACIPADQLVLMSATLLTLIQQVGAYAQCTSIQLSVMNSLRNQIISIFKYYDCGDLPSFLSTSDVRPYLSGDLEVSSILKPIIIMLVHPQCQSLRADPAQVVHAIKAIYTFAGYHAARRYYRDIDRTNVIFELLGINLEEFRLSCSVGELFESDGVYTYISQVDHQASIQRSLLLKWLPNIDDFISYIRFIIGDQPVNRDILQTNINILLYGMVIEALLCPHEVDRIDTVKRIAHGPIPGDQNSVFSYVEKYVSMIYRDDYDKRIKEKRKMEKEMNMKNLLENLINIDNINEFILRLSEGISDRSASGFNELQSKLVNFDMIIPLRIEKLFIIISGRNPLDNYSICWTNGNVLVGKLSLFAKAFEILDNSGEVWKRLLELKNQFCQYNYPREGVNRHGHGNLNPSFYAFGYQTLQEYIDNISEEEFEKYKTNHTNCCGLKQLLFTVTAKK